MITSFVLIRHAESEMNAKFPHLIGGRTNPTPLTEKGLAQAALLGRRFAIERPDFAVVYASPAIRTIGTARAVHDIWGVTHDIIIDDRLQELSQGDWEGKLRADHHTAEVIAAIIELKGRHKAPNGESQYDVEARMVAFMEECLERHQGKTVAAYSHGVAIKCVGRFVQDWDPRKTYHTEIENTSITVVDYHHDLKEWRLRRLNDAAHLTLL